MKNLIKLHIITASGVKYEKMVCYVRLPLESGETGILAGHAPLLAAVADGPVKCRYDDKTDYICVGNGVVNVFNNNVIMLVLTAEEAKDINIAQAQAIIRKARNRINGEDINTDLQGASESLQNALERQKTYRLYWGNI